MEVTINQRYGLCYSEEIHSILLIFGLSFDEACLLRRQAIKGGDLSNLRDKFTGSDRQFDIIVECCKSAVQKGHGIANFLYLGVVINDRD